MNIIYFVYPPNADSPLTRFFVLIFLSIFNWLLIHEGGNDEEPAAAAAAANNIFVEDNIVPAVVLLEIVFISALAYEDTE